MKKHPFCQFDEMDVFLFEETNLLITEYDHVE